MILFGKNRIGVSRSCQFDEHKLINHSKSSLEEKDSKISGSEEIRHSKDKEQRKSEREKRIPSKYNEYVMAKLGKVYSPRTYEKRDESRRL